MVVRQWGLLSVVSVTEGEVSFKLTVSAEMAPDVQVVAYAILPSETVVAHRADFSTEKCFSNKVSISQRLAKVIELVSCGYRVTVHKLLVKKNGTAPYHDITIDTTLVKQSFDTFFLS